MFIPLAFLSPMRVLFNLALPAVASCNNRFGLLRQDLVHLLWKTSQYPLFHLGQTENNLQEYVEITKSSTIKFT
jgi:hypothetical protein